MFGLSSSHFLLKRRKLFLESADNVGYTKDLTILNESCVILEPGVLSFGGKAVIGRPGLVRSGQWRATDGGGRDTNGRRPRDMAPP